MRRSRKRLKNDHEEHISESWLIPYADILTLLLALFIVLFASSEIDNTKYQAIMQSFQSELKGGSVGGGPVESSNEFMFPELEEPVETVDNEAELDQLQQQLEKYINDNDLQNFIALENTERGIEISVKDVILFDTGSDELKSSSYQTLDTISGLMQTVPNQVNIEGHTDNVPIGTAPFRSNWELSAARAVSVLHYFAEHYIDSSRMQFTGYGEYQPLHPNDTEANRQANRRVNIVILRYN
ncbi:flagellar motor protein MotB [Bacillus sp. B15-48]|uniref:flagellar motor protein MotB n=1 Tax=Bacillus sp. B15-48 TaxID=1548601 RepID=UPI00193F6C18|nr:flagellar motor protein MotB [Bacillus sp. B15-48]MBM4764112.1 OmpA family protein [Bacillus sp. B15-48]